MLTCIRFSEVVCQRLSRVQLPSHARVPLSRRAQSSLSRLQRGGISASVAAEEVVCRARGQQAENPLSAEHRPAPERRGSGGRLQGWGRSSHRSWLAQRDGSPRQDELVPQQRELCSDVVRRI